MQRRVVFTDDAADDLFGIEDWYRQGGERASRRLRAIRDGIGRLAEFPLLGANGAVAGTRELTIQDPRVIYDFNENTITVLAIFGPGQNRNAS